VTTSLPAQPIVYVLDRDAAFIRMLRSLLQSVQLDCCVCRTMERFFGQIDHARPGCLLLDWTVPDLEGPLLLRTLATRGITLPVIVITASDEVAKAVQSLQAGAFDYLSKPVSAELLLSQVNRAIRNDLENGHARAAQARVAASFGSLSAREVEVLRLVVAGKPNKQTGSALGISPKTVEVHRKNIMRKLDVRTVAELVRLAVSAGLAVEPPNSLAASQPPAPQQPPTSPAGDAAPTA
jgi:two-component system, LuxR family, response regulator FixJ